MFSKKPYCVSFLLLITLISYSCLKSNRGGIPEPVRRVINQAGLHKVEFLNAMVSYENPDDSLKLKSLYYLIGNMGSHYEISYKVTDTSGHVYLFPVKDYPDYTTLRKHLRLLKEKREDLRVDHDTILLDIHTIGSKLLTQNVDTAMISWSDPVYSQNIYSFNDFSRFILPYRVANEKAEPFRHFLRKRYGTKIFDILHHSHTSLVSLIGRIHQLVTNDIRFDKRYELHYNYPTLNEITNSRQGNYRDLAIYEVKAYRSFGIASVMDYSPYFADSSGGYFWPAVLVSGQHFIPVFYPGVSVDNLTIPGKLPKVYRRKYTNDTTSLFSIKKMSEHTPAFLGQFNYDDVTDEYVPTANITVTLTDTARYAYLAVFNNGQWHPVHWCISNHQTKAYFSKMGTNIVYLPMIVRKEKTIPAGIPFLLQKNRKIRVLDEQATNTKTSVTLTHTTPYYPLKKQQKYFLYQWKNNNWEYAGRFYSSYRGTIKTRLKPLTLYILSEENSPIWFGDERPFIIKKSRILFY